MLFYFFYSLQLLSREALTAMTAKRRSAVEAYLKYAQDHVGGVGRKLIICSTRGLKYSDTKEHLRIKCG